ncbi:hypothetical protein F4560_003527 [Saccharothrix ecbatanensis]|uniref:Uncharacterized protein n=1 Tax=Saccharothrix ecbatanensis TaxID=1105145 RepID=A0A7W9M1A1_9PSEU|nr:hypothetical protein [Saccharothrix ecbatanensis]MBB5803759.1 hypothetical protein [Saccharothrix ecbatanensis]
MSGGANSKSDRVAPEHRGTWPERFAVSAAEQLSARVDGPVLLCRVLDHTNWH